MSGAAFARPVLQKTTAESAAKRVLVNEAKKKGVTIKMADARATCVARDKPPNTFDCTLSERQKRCKGRTQIYMTASPANTSARSTEVTCTKEKRKR